MNIQIQTYKPITHKVNEDGIYNTFIGLTIISNTCVMNNDFWCSVYELVTNEQITRHYALLPMCSYHMTITGITDQRKTNNFDEYFEQYNNELLNGIKNIPIFFNNIRATIKNVVVERVITLYLELNDDDVHTIEQYCETLNINHKKPEYYHVTLGYLYNSITKH